MLENGKLDPATWPNTGMGRLNPDGSKGSCSACHLRHNFSLAQARQPENCGRCHLGPDHPQMEVYTESKHGIAFAANRIRFHDGMDEKEWIPGAHYEQGPTCSSCHMGATKTQPVTHDVGDRISWTLRPPVSEKIDAAALEQGPRRQELGGPTGGHAGGLHQLPRSGVGGQLLPPVRQPGEPLQRQVRPSGHRAVQDGPGPGLFTNDVNFDDKIEFTYFLLWHHEGRRARHGAAMMGPDYTQWHGMFEVADRFYHEFVPELREVIDHGKAAGGGKATAAAEVERRLEEILDSEMHRWVLGKMSPAERAARKRASDEFKKRYAQ